jgi:hypothetical protein
VLGVYVAVVICMGDGDGMVIEVPDDGQSWDPAILELYTFVRTLQILREISC